MSDMMQVIGAIRDPWLHRSLDELGWVDGAEQRLLGANRLRLLTPVPQYPPLESIREEIAQAAPGWKIEVELMSDRQRSEMMSRLRSQSGPGVGESGSRTRVLAVSSGKGGVGKSSVTTNLAVALADRGLTVGVIDADIWGFSIPRMLGVEHPPVVIDESIIPPVAHGVKAMSMDYFVSDDQAVIWRGPMLHKAIEQFLKDVWWDAPDFLLVDMPPGTGDVSISLSQFLPRAQVLLVTTPQPTAQRVARRAALMAEKVNQELLGVVENMSWFTGDDGVRYRIFGEGGGRALAEETGVPLMAQIPLVPEMRAGADDGVPVSLVSKAPGVAEAFAGLAEAVIARKPRIRTHPELVIH